MLSSDIFLGHKLTQDLPLISKSPWKYLVLVSTCLLFVQVVIPFWMIHRKPYDLKPLALILNGLLFGGYLAGFFLGFVATDYGRISFQCAQLDNELTLPLLFQILLAYIFFLFIFLELVLKAISQLMKKSERLTNLEVMSLSFLFTSIYCGIKYNPSNVSAFLPLLSVGINSFDKAFLICNSVSISSISSKQLIRYSFIINVFGCLTHLLHSLYILSLKSCNQVQVTFALLQLMYSCFSFLVHKQKYSQLESNIDKVN